MSSKAALKAAKAALDNEEFDLAIENAQSVLAVDAQNYFARLFLARAFEKKNEPENAAQHYTLAARTKPNESQAWLGLCSVYEGRISGRVDEYREAAVRAAEVLASAGDLDRGQSIIDKLLTFTRTHGSQEQVKDVLMVMIPGTKVYTLLEGRLPQPAHTFTRIAELVESEEDHQMKQQIAERRTRIGARIGQVTLDVQREILGSSNLEGILQEVINWSTDDDVRRQYEEKLLERAYALLEVLPADRKSDKLDQVLTLAEGMVIIHHPFPLAWNIVLESRDMDDLRDLDANTLREYVAFFPEIGNTKIIKSWMSSDLCPFPPLPEALASDAVDAMIEPPLSAEDRLLLMTEGISDTHGSTFAYRLVSEYYLHLEEYSSAVELAQSGLRALAEQSLRLGMSFQNTKDALNSVLGSALIHHQAPRHHDEAKSLFEDILARKGKFTRALIGLGLIYEEKGEFREAVAYFRQALDEDLSNVRIGTELAWCRALSGEYGQALAELQSLLVSIKPDDPQTRDLRAQTLYRIGICLWESESSKAARKDRSGAYKYFLAAIKTNVNFAPAYTSLGIYYQDYVKDKKRARQCFQKAFELSSAEVSAAQHLANAFADQGDWDIVEIIAQRVVDSGRTRPPPGSKKKAVSWPWSALGVVQMNKQEYQKAIVSFLAAIRIKPDDYQSYVGLGESYHNSGRYNSALRTLSFALDEIVAVESETWFAEHMLANVYRELGDYEEAIFRLKRVLLARASELGVLLSLLQTLIECSWKCATSGLFGQAIKHATDSFEVAQKIVTQSTASFNLWKSVGDACTIWSWVQSEEKGFPAQHAAGLLGVAASDECYAHLSDIDRITRDVLTDLETKAEVPRSDLPQSVAFAILSYKRAIHSCSNDIHAQAVAWYNLGCAEQRAYVCSKHKVSKKYLRCAVHCFKRAIELEAANAEFWNALGVATTTLNLRVAQHSFVRSLHLNEHNAKVWANLGVLYLLQNDATLAHQAFVRSQSIDPDYAHAWVGEGLIEVSAGSADKALQHFAHAFEISDSSSVIVRRQYTFSSFDHLSSAPQPSDELASLIQPVFALYQLREQVPQDSPYQHIAALIFERLSDYNMASAILTDICALAEAEYEASEALSILAHFAIAKSDLARIRLASGDFNAAIESSETALTLSSDLETSGLNSESRRRLRLSSHLTAGLAHQKTGAMQSSIEMFKEALVESSHDPEVVCSLAQTLWAHHGEDEKNVAREQLFECIGSYPHHIGAVTLLGAIAALDSDEDSMRAVRDDLISLRTKCDLDVTAKEDIELVLCASMAPIPSRDSGSDTEAQSLAQVQTAVFLEASRYYTWSALANLSGDPAAARMTVRAAMASLGRPGESSANELADALVGVGSVREVQRALFITPWGHNVWQGLGRSI